MVAVCDFSGLTILASAAASSPAEGTSIAMRISEVASSRGLLVKRGSLGADPGRKRLLADAMLDNAALKDLLGKKW
jgi:hypothetical protein